jgi:hypothetical protein
MRGIISRGSNPTDIMMRIRKSLNSCLKFALLFDNMELKSNNSQWQENSFEIWANNF